MEHPLNLWEEMEMKQLQNFQDWGGIFNQGYQCCKCGEGAHKECLSRVALCGKASTSESGSFRTQDQTHSRRVDPGLPKMLAIRNYHGVPSPMCGPALNITAGDIIELIRADLHSTWWQGKVLTTREVGFFPSDAVKPCPCAKPIDYSPQPWFAGRMQRLEAEAELVNRKNSTYLVRHRGHDSNEYAISINLMSSARVEAVDRSAAEERLMRSECSLQNTPTSCDLLVLSDTRSQSSKPAVPVGPK
ncbi:hypothetical protein AOLI_G00054620 [Acnodon oligacanthus]